MGSPGTYKIEFQVKVHRLGLDDIIVALQQNRLRWYGHVLQKDNDWVKKYMDIKWRVPGQEVDQRKLGQRLWKRLPGWEIEHRGCHGS